MKYILIILLLSAPCIKLQAQVNIITTIGGTGVAGYCCDNGPATNAQVNVPEALCLDKHGNIYIADGFNHRIRKIDISTGIITTVAGNGNPGFSGDDSLAINATLLVPEAVFADTSDNIYIADALNDRIRKVTVTTGVITTIAGNGLIGSAGDGGLATNAQFSLPVGLYIDNVNNIFIADYENNKIRKVSASTGIITTIAGNGSAGYSGDGGLAINARLSGPLRLFGDSAGNIFICDQWNHAIRKVNAVTGIITTIAGNGTAGYTGDGGLAIHATLNQPSGIFIDKRDNIFIAEYGNAVIRRIDGTSGIISTVAGTGTPGFGGDGGPPTGAQLRCSGVFLDSNGTIYIADIDNNRIRKVFDPTLGAKSISLNNSGIKLFPNPAKDELTIGSASSLLTNATMTMYDVVGKVVMEQKLNSAKETIDISALNNGVYVVQVYDAEHNTRSMTKLVIAR